MLRDPDTPDPLTSFRYAPERWWMAIADMMRRLVPCWLLLLDSAVRVLMVALLVFFFAVFGWRELKPCWDASSDLIGYAAGWLVVMCIIVQSFSLKIEQGTFLSWFLVLSSASVVALVAWLGAR